MKTAIIYGATTQLTPMHRILQPTAPLPGRANIFQPAHGDPIWVRMEIVNGDALHALDRAKPLAGETVLNSMELP